MKKLIFIVFTLVVVSCNNAPENQHQEIKEEVKELIKSTAKLSKADGEQMVMTNCYACHSPKSTSHDEMLAPPLMGIKYKYSQLYKDRITFIARMADFIGNPTKENALMKGPVRKFGLMPVTTLNDQELREVAAFIFDNNLEVPKWFPEHFEEQHGIKWAE